MKKKYRPDLNVEVIMDWIGSGLNRNLYLFFRFDLKSEFKILSKLELD